MFIFSDIMDGNFFKAELYITVKNKYFPYLAHLLCRNYLYKFVSLDIKDTHLVLSFKPFLIF